MCETITTLGGPGEINKNKIVETLNNYIDKITEFYKSLKNEEEIAIDN